MILHREHSPVADRRTPVHTQLFVLHTQLRRVECAPADVSQRSIFDAIRTDDSAAFKETEAGMTRDTVTCTHESAAEWLHHPVEASDQVGPGSLSYPDVVGEVARVRRGVTYPAIRVHDAARGRTPSLELAERSQAIRHFSQRILR